MKKLIAIKGISNTGKSTSIKYVYNKLLELYPIAKTAHQLLRADIRIIITINGTKIGIESQGDPNSRLLESLTLFSNEQCDIILCATRTSGRTVEAVNALSDKYEINWRNKYKCQTTTNHEESNKKFAEEIFNMIQEVIKNN